MRIQSLNPFQVSFTGINLIEASAGTGKTYNIASLYVQAIIEHNKTVDQILVVTYTEAATKELKDRLIKRLRESVLALRGEYSGNDEFLQKLVNETDDSEQAPEKLNQAIRTFDEAAVFTIHGFCRQVLQNQAFESRALFDTELIGDDSEIIGELIADFWRNWVADLSKNLQKLPLLKLLKDKGYSPDLLTEELAPFIGKPYLQTRPDKFAIENLDERLDELDQTYAKIQKEWSESHQEIFTLLNEASLAHYRTGWLKGWMLQMHDWIKADVPAIVLFDQFEKFTQPKIDDSLKKNASGPPPKHPFFELAEAYCSIAEPLEKFEVHFKLRLFDYLKSTLDSKKEQLKVYSFDDLLIKLHDALLDSKRGKKLRKTLRTAYPVALVDEFQDTDPIQYRIFKSIYSSGNHQSALFMIGDPKQSIYSFRGADIYTYLQAQLDVPDDKMFSLNRNFRSVPPLIDAVNALFSYQENPFILDKISYSKVKPGKDNYDRLTIKGETSAPVMISKLGLPSDDFPINKGTAEHRSAEHTAAQIYQLLAKAKKGKAKIGEKKVKAGDIAVLVRSHKQAGMISEALQERGLKSVKYSQKSVFKSDEARDLQYVLKALAEPNDERLVKAALTTNFMGYTAEDLLLFEGNDQQWIDKLEQFSGWNNLWQGKGIGNAFWQMMYEEEIPQKLIGLQNGERKLTNFIHLTELLQQQEQNGKTGTRNMLHWLARKRNESQKEADEEQLRLESDENLVKVVTMHRSKGLEYPIVFCPFLWKGAEFTDNGGLIVYHDSENKSAAYVDFNGKNDPERDRKRLQYAREEVAESIRLAYVAVTRAKHQCNISWVHAAKTEFSALGYLLLGNRQSFDILERSIKSGSKYEAVDSALFESSFDDLQSITPRLFDVNSHKYSENGAFIKNEKNPTVFKARKFSRKARLEAGARISSFSSLTCTEHEPFEDMLPLYFDEPEKADGPGIDDQSKSVFSFPRGPGPGTAVHHIFEKIDFNEPKDWNTVIEKELDKNAIEKKWAPTAKNMLQATLKKGLHPDNKRLCLEKLYPKDRIEELEFYFSSGEVHLEELLQIIRPKSTVPATAEGFSEEGFLKGFIDLTFKYDGHYYILDYKTNHLGDTIADYRLPMLEDEMREAYYDLQYHIYCVALHRFLRSRLKDYSYNAHFGGAFYLFLRGLNDEGREGIYFDRPDESTINNLDQYLGREER